MNKAKRILFTIVLCLTISPLVSAEPGCRPYKFGRGVESGGGGTILWENDVATLLDFLQIDREFRDTRPELASYIETPRTLLYNRYDGLLSAYNLAFEHAFKILRNWRAAGLNTASAPSLEFSILTPTTWLFIDEDVCRPSEKISAPDLRWDLRLAAYYLKDRHQVNISRPLWNKMGLKSQVGLIIHESIRHVQIGLKNDFDEEILQQATALMVMCKPTPRLSQYIQAVLSNRRDLAEKSFGAYSEVLKECTAATSKF